MSRASRQKKLPKKSELPSIFSVRRIEEIANAVFKRDRHNVDLDALRSDIIRACEVYIDLASSPSAGEVKREIAGLLRAAHSKNRPSAFIRKWKAISQEALQVIEANGRKRTLVSNEKALLLATRMAQLKARRKRALSEIMQRVEMSCIAGFGPNGVIPKAPVTSTHARKRDQEFQLLVQLGLAIARVVERSVGMSANESGGTLLSSLAGEVFETLNLPGVHVANTLRSHRRLSSKKLPTAVKERNF